MPRAVALIGFMGAGKSRVGSRPRQLLQVPFTDTDALIAEQHGPIEEIFAQHGEAHFRALERDVAVAALQSWHALPGVVSLGGGAVHGRRRARRAVAVCRTSSGSPPRPSVLFARASEGGRPLARDEAAFRRLLRGACPLYRSLATHAVVNDGVAPIDEVAAEVAALAGG